MANTIKQEVAAFGAYVSISDWGLGEDSHPTIELYVNGGNGKGYVTLTIEEAHQAIEILKDAIKQSEKNFKKAQKRNKKAREQERF